MNIVVDANIVIAALLGSRGKLTILTSQNHTFYAPKKIIDDIHKYKTEICEKAGQTPEEFEQNFEALLMFINTLQYLEYESHISKAQEVIRERDAKDADYIACALAVNADFIWTDDKDFISQKLVLTKTTDAFIRSGKD
jgi:predicted nucleic acid-binding protein